MNERNKTSEINIPLSLEAILDYVSSRTNDGEDVCELPEQDYDTVTSFLGISRVQAELLAAILENNSGSGASSHAVARQLGCSYLHLLSFKHELDDLMDKRLVRSRQLGHQGVTYYIPADVVKALQTNDKPKCADISGLDSHAIVARWNRLMSSYWRDNLDIESLKREMLDLIRFNQESELVVRYNGKGLGNLSENEQLLFIYCLVRNVVFAENSFSWYDYARLFSEETDEIEMKYETETGECPLFKLGLIEFGNDEGVVDNSQIRLTAEAEKLFVRDLRHSGKETLENSNVIKTSDIAAKQLFYNPEEGKQVEKLMELLDRNNFSNVVSRLKQKGFRSGFCCLLYGTPGTGKTETVYQVARRTGRDVFLVDVAQLKSKWVGDSEKTVRSLFNEYKALVRSTECAPILLFNEADAIFGIRKKGADSAVEKMENAIQNIILNEMETLEGILIATTNLTSQFDTAFERRFLLKLNLSNPSVEARSHIWESLVEGMSSEDAQTLASEYEFSGGQIENISRKMTVDYILSGMQPGLDSIREMCRNETIRKSSLPRTQIGF